MELLNLQCPDCGTILPVNNEVAVERGEVFLTGDCHNCGYTIRFSTEKIWARYHGIHLSPAPRLEQ